MKTYANTVGSPTLKNKKDIYIIRNDINNKVYIGQSVDAENRFIQHCKPSSNDGSSLISKAIQKYGAEHFHLEILEKGVNNYNDRERYWINKFNSIQPCGYNIQSGGEEPPTFCSINHPLSPFGTINEVNALKDDLKNTKMSLRQIAEKYNVSKRTVLRINQGLHYEVLDEKYPIREQPLLCGKLNDEQVEEIIEILRYTYRQYEDIASQYHISISAVKQINSGDCHPLENIIYPIRDYKNSGKPACTYEQVTTIGNELMNSKKSCRKIAQEHNVDLQTVYIINNGNAKRYRRKEWNYPLRQHNSGRKPVSTIPAKGSTSTIDTSGERGTP